MSTKQINFSNENSQFKFTLNPKLSISFSNNIDFSKKTKLEIYKQHLLNIRARKQMIPPVPQPLVIECFNILKDKKSIQYKKQTLRKQIKQKKQTYDRLKKHLEKYQEVYQNKQQALKEKILLSKILSSKLQTEFSKTREQFKELQFSKIMNTAQKKLLFYQLAQIFYNNQARKIFELDKQTKNDQGKMGICLGYMALLIDQVAGIASVETWIKLKFKGPKSMITVYDPKTIEINGYQNQSRELITQTFILNSRESRFNQGLNYLCEQLRQIMRYSLGMQLSKSSNFYQLCQQLSKFLLNV